MLLVFAFGCGRMVSRQAAFGDDSSSGSNEEGPVRYRENGAARRLRREKQLKVGASGYMADLGSVASHPDLPVLSRQPHLAVSDASPPHSDGGSTPRHQDSDSDSDSDRDRTLTRESELPPLVASPDLNGPLRGIVKVFNEATKDVSAIQTLVKENDVAFLGQEGLFERALDKKKAPFSIEDHVRVLVLRELLCQDAIMTEFDVKVAPFCNRYPSESAVFHHCITVAIQTCPVGMRKQHDVVFWDKLDKFFSIYILGQKIPRRSNLKIPKLPTVKQTLRDFCADEDAGTDAHPHPMCENMGHAKDYCHLIRRNVCVPYPLSEFDKQHLALLFGAAPQGSRQRSAGIKA